MQVGCLFQKPMNEIEVSEALLPVVQAHPNMEVLSEPYELSFDENGNLF